MARCGVVILSRLRTSTSSRSRTLLRCLDKPQGKHGAAKHIRAVRSGVQTLHCLPILRRSSTSVFAILSGSSDRCAEEEAELDQTEAFSLIVLLQTSLPD